MECTKRYNTKKKEKGLENSVFVIYFRDIKYKAMTSIETSK